MKILLFNNAYKAYVNPSNPCRKCIFLNRRKLCSDIPASFCAEYGGFQSSDTKIFTL